MMDDNEFAERRAGIAAARGTYTPGESHAPTGVGTGIGSILGTVIGGLAAIPTGGLSIPAGAMLGSTLGSATGKLAEDAIAGEPSVRDAGSVISSIADLARKRAEAEGSDVGELG